MRKFAWLFAASAALVWCVPAQADLTAGQKMAVEALVKQFTAADFDARQKAVDRLIEMGVDVAPIVRKALADTADNEVKMRCEQVLKALRDKFGAAAVDGARIEVPAGDKSACEASRVTFDFKDVPLAEVVDRLAEFSGNRPFRVDEKLRDKTLTLSVKDATYWEAVDQAAAKLGLVYSAYWTMGMGRGGNGESSLQLVEAEKDLKITGYASPAVVKADYLSKIEFLRVAKQPAWGMPGQEGLSLGLTWFWEDRLGPLTEEIELTKAVTPKGDSLLPTTPEGRRKANPMGFMGMPGFKPAPCATVQFSLPMPAPDARTVAELSGVVRLEFATGEREVMIDDVFAKVGKEVKVDDWTITVKKVDGQKNALLVTIEAKYKGEPVDLPSYWTAGTYGWYVQTTEGGKRTRGFSYGSGRATVGVAWGLDGGRLNPQARAQPVQKGESAVYFQGEYEAGVTNVVLVLPKLHETREYPFTIKDIPLP